MLGFALGELPVRAAAMPLLRFSRMRSQRRERYDNSVRDVPTIEIALRVWRSAYSFGLSVPFGARLGSAGFGGCRNVRNRSKRSPSLGFLAAGAPPREFGIFSVDMGRAFSGKRNN